jgi:hypothetical protein
VKSVLTAEFAILLQLKSVGRILLVLFCVVVSLLALGACESNLDSGIISHIVGTSCDSLFDRFLVRSVYLPLAGADRTCGASLVHSIS